MAALHNNYKSLAKVGCKSPLTTQHLHLSSNNSRLKTQNPKLEQWADSLFTCSISVYPYKSLGYSEVILQLYCSYTEVIEQLVSIIDTESPGHLPGKAVD
jgi:hypothetical protein